MSGITEQYTGTITDEEGNVVVDESGNEVIVPNPDYPQEITNAGVYNEETGRYKHKCCVGNKNWFDLSKARDESNYEYDGGTIPFAHFPVFVGKGNTVTFSCKLPSDDNAVPFYTAIIVDNVGGKTLSYFWYKNSTNNTHDTVTITSPNDYIYLRFSTSYALEWLDYFDNVQIEYGTSKTNYVTPIPQFTLTSPVPITKWDKLVKRDGVWGWSVWSKHYENVTESNIGSNLYGDTYRFAFYATPAFLGAECFCNIAPFSKTRKAECCGYWDGANRLTFQFSAKTLGLTEEEAATGEAVRNKAFKDNILSKGITVISQMNEEQAFHPLLDEEQALLNNLETYYGVTNVYNEQGCPMWLTYVNDTKLYVDSKLLEIQQAII